MELIVEPHSEKERQSFRYYSREEKIIVALFLASTSFLKPGVIVQTSGNWFHYVDTCNQMNGEPFKHTSYVKAMKLLETFVFADKLYVAYTTNKSYDASTKLEFISFLTNHTSGDNGSKECVIIGPNENGVAEMVDCMEKYPGICKFIKP